jgi:hypothetical protein
MEEIRQASAVFRIDCQMLRKELNPPQGKRLVRRSQHARHLGFFTGFSDAENCSGPAAGPLTGLVDILRDKTAGRNPFL